VVHDADDTRIDRGLARIERETRFLAAHEKDLFAYAGAHRINGNQRTARRLMLQVERLDEQQRGRGQTLVLSGGDDGADDAGKLHGSIQCWDC
jgi:hypothetical protein